MRHSPVALLVAGALLVSCDTGSRQTVAPSTPADASVVRQWNAVAIDATGLDHAPSSVGPSHVFGQQVGPCRASRAMAIVHVAMFEAMNAIAGSYDSMVGVAKATRPASVSAAVAQAAYDALTALYPSQGVIFATPLVEALAAETDTQLAAEGVAIGHAAATAVLQQRANDGSAHAEPRVNVEHTCSDDPGHWRQDPVSHHPLALGAWWSAVRPWVLQSPDQFRCPPPPAIDTAEYAVAYAEVYAFGGDGVTTPTLRTQEQAFIGSFWAYDGMPSLCAPPRLYNQIAVHIADQQGTTGLEFARLLALVNVAMADAGSAAWESKYHFDFWRPVGGIRESDPGTGPSGLGDDNPLTACDPTWMPLGAPASNATGPNFTPPFPAYPSGHATFGGALFQMLRRIYGTDDIPFTFVSDEWNGVTRDNQGNVRPRIPRSFATLSEAEEENGQSRIYLGIHWSFDKTAGITQGNQVADWVFEHLYVQH